MCTILFWLSPLAGPFVCVHDNYFFFPVDRHSIRANARRTVCVCFLIIIKSATHSYRQWAEIQKKEWWSIGQRQVWMAFCSAELSNDRCICLRIGVQQYTRYVICSFVYTGEACGLSCIQSASVRVLWCVCAAVQLCTPIWLIYFTMWRVEC